MIETNLVALAGTSEAAQDKIAGVLDSEFGFAIISAADLISSEVFKRPHLSLFMTDAEKDEVARTLQKELGLGWISSKVISASKNEKVCVIGINTPADSIEINENGGISLHAVVAGTPEPNDTLRSLHANQTMDARDGSGSDLPYVMRNTSAAVDANPQIRDQLVGILGFTQLVNHELFIAA